METRLSNIFKTTIVTNLAKVIQEGPYRVLKVTSKSKTLKQSAYFLKAVEFCPTFDIQIAKPHLLESLQKSLKTRQHINRATDYVIKVFQKYKKFVFFWRLLFQKKI